MKTVKRIKKVAKKTKKKGAKKSKGPKRKKSVWDYAWLQGDARKQVFQLNRELAEGHTQTNGGVIDESWIEEAMDILVQWAQLGEGERCEDFAEDVLLKLPKSDRVEYYDQIVKIYRRVLHAHLNQFKSLAWNPRNRRPNYKLDDKLLEQAKLTLTRADEVLKKMEKASRAYVKEATETYSGLVVKPGPIMTGGDYEPLIFSHCHVKNVVQALQTLRKNEGQFSDSDNLQRLAPSETLYSNVLKTLLSGPKNVLYERSGVRYSPADMAEQLVRSYADFTRKCPDFMKPSLPLYNIALDAWSRTLPPPSKSSTIFKSDKNKVLKEAVAKQVDDLWHSMMVHDRLLPTSKSYTSMIYTYCKTGDPIRAYKKFEELVQRVLAWPEESMDEGVDSRSFRMLANLIARNAAKDEESAGKIEFIIESMWKLDQAGFDDVAPDVFIYTTAINAWAETRSPNSIQRSEMLLQGLQRKSVEFPDNKLLQLDAPIYNALMNAVAKQLEVDNAPVKAGSIVKRMKDSGIKPDIITHNILIEACLRSEDGVDKAVQTLNRMIEERNPLPNETTFKSVILALVEMDGQAETAENILDRMEERYTPPATIYEKIIKCWCNEPEQAGRAKKLLERMEELHQHAQEAYDEGNESLKPKRSLYTMVIRACGDQGNTDDAELLKRKRKELYSEPIGAQKFKSTDQIFALLDKIDTDITHDDRPAATTANFNTILGLLSKSEKIWAGQRAEDTLNYILELAIKRKNTDVRPNIVTFNSVMAAWARSGHPKAGEKAANILHKLDELHKMGFLKEIVPDRITYNTLISAHAKSEALDSAVDANRVFKELQRIYEETRDENLKPNIISYATLLNAWANSEAVGAPERAEEILRRMLDENREDPTKPKPNTACFNEVLYAWARNYDRVSAERAELFFELMEDMQDSDIKPDSRSYNLVLLAFANSPQGNSAMRAKEFLDRMGNSDIAPDGVSYNTLISAFTKKGGFDNTDTALEILKSAIDSQDTTLDSKFFSTLFYTISDSDIPNKTDLVEEICALVMQKKADGSLDVEIDTQVYNALIYCWNRSRDPVAPFRVDDILDEMLVQSASGNPLAAPDVVTYTNVIDTWARSREKLESPARAERHLDNMDVKPNTHTYRCDQNHCKQQIQ